MAKSPRTDASRDTTPQHFPDVTPPTYSQAVGAGYMVESMMQMQQSLGELKATVSHLREASDKQSSKLDRISHIVFSAGVVLAIILAIGGFFLNKIWDGVFSIMMQVPPPPTPGP